MGAHAHCSGGRRAPGPGRHGRETERDRTGPGELRASGAPAGTIVGQPARPRELLDKQAGPTGCRAT
eukprot:3373190-Prymnesium_polylepis.1